MLGLTSYVFFFSVLYITFAKEVVPVLIWNTNHDRGESLPAVSALQHISFNSFQTKYLNAFKPENILVFLQDELSIEDLSSHVREFSHVGQWMESGQSLYLPNVEEPSRIVHDLHQQGYNVITLDSNSNDAGLMLKDKSQNMIVVKLPSTHTNPSRRRALQKADEVMQNVISKIGKLRNFTVIYTGIQPSVDINDHYLGERIRVARAAAESTNTSSGQVFNASCALIYLPNDMSLYIAKNTSSTPNQIMLPTANIVNVHSDGMCNTSQSNVRKGQIIIVFNNINASTITFTKLSVSLQFELRNRKWSGTTAEVDTTEGSKVPDRFYLQMVGQDMTGIPLSMSFACALRIKYQDANATLDEGKATLILNGIQVQPFSEKAANTWRFDGAWDCVGFFTVPIWCGLLVSLLLLIALAMGLYMLGDIKTMDRFDDPKGKTITVPNSE